MRLFDGHLARFPHGAVYSQRPSLPHTPVYDFLDLFFFKHKKHRRLEDCFNDIPDSDPDSDDVDHPLEKAGYLSKREINQILAVKIKKLKELYKAELNAVNNDLIRYTIFRKIFQKHFWTKCDFLIQGRKKR